MLGHFARGLSACEQAERDARALQVAAAKADDKAGAEEAEATVLNATDAKISILLDMGQVRRAVAIAEPFLDDEHVGDDFKAQTHAHLGMGLASIGEYPQAAEHFDAAMRGFESEVLRPYRGWLYMLRGLMLHASAGAWAKAETDARAALERVTSGTEDHAYAKFTLGVAQAGSGSWSDALANLEVSLGVATDLDIVDLQSMVLSRMAECRLALDQPIEAVKLARRAALALDLASAGLADEEGIAVRAFQERARLFETWERAGRAASTEQDRSLEYEALESARARLLLAAMGGSQRARGLDLPAELREEERFAQRRLLASRERFLRVLARRRSPEAIQAARARMKDARERWLDTVSRVQRHAGARAALAFPSKPELGELQAALAEDEACVIFDGDGAVLHALVVRTKEVCSRPIEGWPALSASCLRIAGRDVIEDQGAFERLAAELRKKLIASLQLPDRVQRLVIVPAESMTGLPWSAVAAREGRPLDVRLAPSASAWLVLKNHDRVEGRPMLAVGDPIYRRKIGGRERAWHPTGQPLPRLEGSGREVRAIQREGDVVLLRADATERRFKTLAAHPKGWDVVTLACHGLVDEETPCMTCVALGPDDEQDGLVTATEVFGMNCWCNLLVLSACDVGRAQHRPGAGLHGLVRAFMAAHAPRLLTSIWPADDEATVLLVTTFHRERRAGRSLDEALREAQRAVREKKDDKGKHPWAAPSYWAGWVLWGPGN